MKQNEHITLEIARKKDEIIALKEDLYNANKLIYKAIKPNQLNDMVILDTESLRLAFSILSKYNTEYEVYR